jgi:hypothetical protein
MVISWWFVFNFMNTMFSELDSGNFVYCTTGVREATIRLAKFAESSRIIDIIYDNDMSFYYPSESIFYVRPGAVLRSNYYGVDLIRIDDSITYPNLFKFENSTEFSGVWSEKYEFKAVKMLFNSESVDGMVSRANYEYCDDGVEAVRLWMGEAYDVVIVLANTWLDDYLDLDFRSVNGSVTLPIFNLSCENNLNFLLDGASLKQDIGVSKFEQVCKMQFGLRGVSFTAVTGFQGFQGYQGPNIPLEEVDFIADRPFYFVVSLNDKPLLVGGKRV